MPSLTTRRRIKISAHTVYLISLCVFIYTALLLNDDIAVYNFLLSENDELTKPPPVERCRDETIIRKIHSREFCSIQNGGLNQNNFDKKGDFHFDLIRKKLESMPDNTASFLFSTEENENESILNINTIVIPNALCYNTNKVNDEDVTLTTQMTPNKMSRLVALTTRFNGPLSVAILIRSVEAFDDFRDRLHNHWDELSENVMFHLCFESNNRSYPNNILRNLAIEETKSDYFALFDVDLLPSPLNTHQHLKNIFKNNPEIPRKLSQQKTVFVMPAFELSDTILDDNITALNSLYPDTREEVIQEFTRTGSERRVFAFKELSGFPQGHLTTNYTKWISPQIDVSYIVDVQEYGYEPYIIAAKENIPQFFPLFRGYGFNKLSFYAELLYAKYRFEVLRDVFIFHVNHPSSFGDKKNSDFRKNKICVRYFRDHLAKYYGAGTHADKSEEIPGWDRWNWY